MTAGMTEIQSANLDEYVGAPPGADADIAVVDAATVIDRSTYREPALAPIGIRHVLVNGVAVVANGRTVDGVTPGQPVRAPAIRP
jgi:N-acyl-D-aspartate/D-glutamate deacylase